MSESSGPQDRPQPPWGGAAPDQPSQGYHTPPQAYQPPYPPQPPAYPPHPVQAYPPQPSPAYPPSAYPGESYPQGLPLREHPRATLAFVLGLLSVLGLTILGPFGWYIGTKVVREIDRDPAPYTNRGLAVAGKVLGIIGTVFLVLTVLFFGLAVVIAVVGAATPAHTGTGRI